MRKFLKVFLAVLISGNCFAQSDTTPTREWYFGINIPRLVAKDFEMQAAMRLEHNMIVGISAGYDFNAPRKWFTQTRILEDTANWSAGYWDDDKGTSETGRYFFGEGFVVRVFFENTFVNKRKKTGYFSIEALWKTRDYRNYLYKENGLQFLESANQNILGGIFYIGRYSEMDGFLMLKYFWGFGARIMNSNITRPGYFFRIQRLGTLKRILNTSCLFQHCILGSLLFLIRNGRARVQLNECCKKRMKFFFYYCKTNP